MHLNTLASSESNIERAQEFSIEDLTTALPEHLNNARRQMRNVLRFITE